MIQLCTGQEDVEKAPGSWWELAMENQLNEKWSLPVAVILSYENLAEQTEFGLIQGGLTYKSSPKMKFTLGTAYVDSQPIEHHELETLTTQFWLYEETTFLSGQRFDHRLRLEHRWIDSPTENTFNSRTRYRLGFKQKITEQLYLRTTNEVFFDFNEMHFNENRFFLGVGSKVNEDLSFELGYFKTNVGADNFNRMRFALFIKTDFLSKKDEATTHEYLSDTLKEYMSTE